MKGGYRMKKPYIYNTKTHTLHIEGFCHNTFEGMHYSENFKCFASEDEVMAFDGRSVSMCKLCSKKRESIIKSKKLET